MVIPPGQERVGHLKLEKKAIVTHLGKPVNKVQHIPGRVRALDAHTPVEEGGFSGILGRKVPGPDVGNHLHSLPRS